MRVPPTLDHFVPVLPGQRQGEGLGQVTWGHRRKGNERRHSLGHENVVDLQTVDLSLMILCETLIFSCKTFSFRFLKQ